MAYCNFCDRCFFFNEQLIDNLSSNAELLRVKYCADIFTECAIYKLAISDGIGRVCGFVYPDDFLEDLDTLPPKTLLQHGGDEKYLKVIYPDGTTGRVISSTIDVLVKDGKIVAFLCSEGWVEVRRKHKDKCYFDKDRRKSNFVYL